MKLDFRTNMEKLLKSVKDLYDRNIELFGTNFKSVGWKDHSSQYLRFDKLAYVMQPNSHGVSINDFGCGYGEMFNYLKLKLGYNLIKYNGYDISNRMLNAAVCYTEDSRTEFFKSDSITQVSDFSFASGTFYVKNKIDTTIWTEYIINKIEEMNAMSNIGFSFNLLSSFIDYKDTSLYYGDPLFFFDFCKRNISSYVSLLHDYPLFEFTVCVRKT